MGGWRLSLNRGACTGCGACIKGCPNGVIVDRGDSPWGSVTCAGSCHSVWTGVPWEPWSWRWMPMDSCQGEVLKVGLNSGRAEVEPLNREWARDYYGGKGLGLHYLASMAQARVQPLEPKSPLILVTGPFTGTAVPCSEK